MASRTRIKMKENAERRRNRRWKVQEREGEPDMILLDSSCEEEDEGVSVSRTEDTCEALTKGSGSSGAFVTEEKQRRRRRVLKGKRVAKRNDVVFLGETVDRGELGSGKRKRESAVFISIDDSDDDDNGAIMGKKVPVHVVDVKEEVLSEDSNEIYVVGGKGENFNNRSYDFQPIDLDVEEEHVVAATSSDNAVIGTDGGEKGLDKSGGVKMCNEFDEEGRDFHDGDFGWGPDLPIVYHFAGSPSEDESSEGQSGSADAAEGDVDESPSESEDDNSSDEDYKGDEVTDSSREFSCCESSTDDDDDDGNEKLRRRERRYMNSGRSSRPSNDQAEEEDMKKQGSFRFHHTLLSQKRTRDSTKVDDSEMVDDSERNSPIADANDSVIGNLSPQGGGGGGEECHGKNGFEEKDGDDIHQVEDGQPPVSTEDMDVLWAEMDLGLKLDERGSDVRIASSLRRKQAKKIMRRESAVLADDNRVSVDIGTPGGGEKHHGKNGFEEKDGDGTHQVEDAQSPVSTEDMDMLWAEMDLGIQSDDKGSGVRIASSLQRKEGKKGESSDQINRSNHGKRVDGKFGHIDGHHRVQRMPLKRKEQRLLDLLSECLLGKHMENKANTNVFEENDDDIPRGDTPPQADVEKTPFRCDFKEPETLKRSKSEEELDLLWDEMELELRSEEIQSQVTTEAKENQTFICNHDFRLDEQIGIICRKCDWLQVDIKYVMAPVVDDDYAFRGSRSRRLYDEDRGLRSYDTDFTDGDRDASSPQNEGTVWDLIPGVKQSLYPHQQEGFEFIWANLAGTTSLDDLKTVDPSSAGGCIISHAPGTGKTRLTIVFLQTYLEVFPKCRPVIIAPANILLTWEDEFKKWDLGVPFHNLNSLELTGKEHLDATKEVDFSGSLKKDDVRMVKLISWFKDKSILGISYQLYEKLAGGKRKEKRHVSMKENTEAEISVMGNILLEVPGLLVLDEGHTPRNQHSSIWKVLSTIQTQKRIILSGTPFQNNFVELYNTLCLVKPSFPDIIPLELKKFCQSRLRQKKKAPKEFSWEPVYPGTNTPANPSDDKIKQLKLWMDPIVHIHKGSILQENLLGLRDCVLSLNPDRFQKEILESIEKKNQSALNFEHKLALASVHPSLFLCCALTEKEESVVDRDRLESLRLIPHEGAKTRFVVEFVRLCDAVREKVLVFSQFIDPLNLIMDQLKKTLNWDEGKEVLLMSGKLDQKKKQNLIHGFNSEKSQTKVLLASTKACSEGINLVGASRVVLLDVVWNPSVERQAISRAYRLGQTRVVYTYHLLVEGTAESAKYCKQAEKDRISELVFSDRNTEDGRTKSGATNLEDKVLDKMIKHEKLKDLFAKCVTQPKERDLIESFGS